MTRRFLKRNSAATACNTSVTFAVVFRMLQLSLMSSQKTWRQHAEVWSANTSNIITLEKSGICIPPDHSGTCCILVCIGVTHQVASCYWYLLTSPALMICTKSVQCNCWTVAAVRSSYRKQYTINLFPSSRKNQHQLPTKWAWHSLHLEEERGLLEM